MSSAPASKPIPHASHGEFSGASGQKWEAAPPDTGHWTLITPFFWPQVGGVQQYLGMLCRALGPANVTIIGPKLRQPEAAAADQSLSEYAIRRPVSDRLRFVYNTGVSLLETRRRRGGIIVGVARPNAVGAVALRRLLGVPYVVCCHGKELVSTARLRRWTNRLLLRYADGVIANSAFTAQLAIRSGARPATVRILRPAFSAPPDAPDLPDRCMELRRRHNLEGRRVLLTVGRLVARKGHEQVLRSLKALIGEHDELRYVIVGDGPERNRLERIVSDAGLSDAVLFTGRVSDQELRAWYQLADIFVMVSRSDEQDIEGFGIVYLEAAFAGLPVIAGRGGGVEDAMVPGVTGLLVDPLSTTELTAALRRLIDNPDEAVAMGDAGRNWVAHEASEERFVARAREILAFASQESAAPRPKRNPMRRLPLLGRTKRRGRRREFVNSTDYWKRRYAEGRDSGVGSHGFLAEFKAQVLNEFVEHHGIASVIGFGCGDGNQLLLARYPTYSGYDVSPDAIARCKQLFAGDGSKTFRLLEAYDGERADLAISLDVIYHLVEDDVFEAHMEMLFDASDRFVVIYSSNSDEQMSDAPHVKHRKFTNWVDAHRPDWALVEHIPNPYPYSGDHTTGSFSDFYVFEKRAAG